MRSIVLGSILVGLIAIPNRPEAFDLKIGIAVDRIGGDPPEGHFAASLDSECALDAGCEEDGDSCNNGWGTECTAHHEETKMFPGQICSSAENQECFLWTPLNICKFRLTCGFDEDENCVTTVNVTNILASSDCLTLPL